MMREFFKLWLERRGWYLRRVAGLPVGVDLALFVHTYCRLGDGFLFDVGAHQGETVGYFLRNFGNPIHAFEPVRRNFEELSRKYSANPGVHLSNLALGDSAGSVTIALQADSQTHSLRQQVDGDKNGNVQMVQVATLDQVIRERAIERIEILKIDTEGWELQVLKGGEQSLAQGKIRMIFCEVTLDPYDQVHTPLDKLCEWLLPRGFRLCGLFDQIAWQSPLHLAYANALFVHE